MGDILRPGAEALSRRSLQAMFTPYYNLLRQAGREVIQDGAISENLQTEIRKDLFPGGKQAFYDMAGAYWEQQMDRFKVPDEKRHTVPILAADLDAIPYAPGGDSSVMEQVNGRFPVTNEQMLQYLAGMYNPQAIPELRATIQFTFVPPKVPFDSGPANWFLDIGGRMYHLRIEGSSCAAHRTPGLSTDLTIYAPADVWLAVSKGELDGQEAFISGQYRATGNMGLILKMNDLFTSIGAVSEPSPIPEPIQEEHKMIDMNSLNCHATIAGMSTVFNADVAGDLTAAIQFHVTGEEPGSYYLDIENGACTFRDGQMGAPTMTINTPSEIWLAISRGEMDGQMAFMQQKYTVEGDFGLLLKMSQLFQAG